MLHGNRKECEMAPKGKSGKPETKSKDQKDVKSDPKKVKSGAAPKKRKEIAAWLKNGASSKDKVIPPPHTPPHRIASHRIARFDSDLALFWIVC